MKRKPHTELPSQEIVKQELNRVQYRSRYRTVIRSTIFTLITVAAAAVLVATLWMPVLQIYGSSMTPTLMEGDILISFKGTKFASGDVIAFYYNNKVLVKRVIALPGDWVDIREDGSVYVNDELLDEPYLTGKSFGDSDLEYPYQVPPAKYFVMGDHRNVSEDSRQSTVGCVSEEQVVGQIVFRVWPLDTIGSIH